MVDVPRQRLDERLVGDAELVVAAPEQDGRSLRVRSERELRRQPCLADPRLTGDEHDAAFTFGRGLPLVDQRGEVLVATHEREAGAGVEAWWQWPCLRGDLWERFPAHPRGGDGFGEALELDRSHALECLDRSRAGDDLDHVGADDPVRLREVAEARGLHDRRTEEVAVVVARVAEADPDPHRERLGVDGMTVAALDLLLDLDAACEGFRGTGERGHAAVAGPLHDFAVVAGYRAGDDRIVLSAQLVGGVVTEATALFGRTDEVGEHDGPRAVPHRHVEKTTRRADVVDMVKAGLVRDVGGRREHLRRVVCVASSGATGVGCAAVGHVDGSSWPGSSSPPHRSR